jgi:hypothetical protein
MHFLPRMAFWRGASVVFSDQAVRAAKADEVKLILDSSGLMP